MVELVGELLLDFFALAGTVAGGVIAARLRTETASFNSIASPDWNHLAAPINFFANPPTKKDRP